MGGGGNTLHVPSYSLIGAWSGVELSLYTEFDVIMQMRIYVHVYTHASWQLLRRSDNYKLKKKHYLKSR
jgi:hypothetical protein